MAACRLNDIAILVHVVHYFGSVVVVSGVELFSFFHKKLHHCKLAHVYIFCGNLMLDFFCNFAQLADVVQHLTVCQ